MRDNIDASAVTTFDEFVAAASRWFRRDDREEAAFLSGESFEQGVRRWWGEVLELEVTSPGEYRLVCPGCHEPISVEGDIYKLPMFEYAIWRLCKACRIVGGEAE